MKLEDLKRLDLQKLQASWRSLDPENIGAWPLPFRVAIWLAIVAIIVFGGYMVFITGQIDALQQARADEVTKKADFENKAFKAANLAVYKKQLADMEESFGALLRQLPKETEVPGLLEDISQAALGSGLDVQSISLQSEKMQDFYAEDPIQIKVQGDYHAFGSFVSAIAALPRIVTLHDFSIAPVSASATASSGSPLLAMNITAMTYRYLDQGELDKKGKGKGSAGKGGAK